LEGEMFVERDTGVQSRWHLLKEEETMTTPICSWERDNHEMLLHGERAASWPITNIGLLNFTLIALSINSHCRWLTKLMLFINGYVISENCQREKNVDGECLTALSREVNKGGSPYSARRYLLHSRLGYALA
jgi:hypothetical protein